MRRFRQFYRLFFNRVFAQKITAYALLILFFSVFHHFLFVFFLTFIFGYLFYTFSKFLKVKTDLLLLKYIKDQKLLLKLKEIISINLIAWIVYIAFLWFLIYTIITLPQKLTQELNTFANQVPLFQEYIMQINQKLIELRNIWSEIWKSFWDIISQQDVDLLMQILDKAKAFWITFLKVIIALVLSFIFIIDRNKLSIYLKTVEKSNFGFLYTEYKTILEKIVKTFWAAFRAQSFIALANAILTTVWLLIIWFFNTGEVYPFIYTLAIIVFICWFIPIIGLFISSIPVFIIGFTMVGGLSVVIQIIILLIIINLIETYYLNPKIVSSVIHLPISLTFVVLVVSEHFLWFAWLVLWIWFFYLAIELLKDADRLITKSRSALSEINQIKNETKTSIKDSIRLSRGDKIK